MAYTICRLARSGRPVPGVVRTSVATRTRRRRLVERRPWRGAGVAGFHADALAGLRGVAGPARIARTLSRRGGPKGWSCQPHADEAGYSCGCDNALHFSSLAEVGRDDPAPLGITDGGAVGITISSIFFWRSAGTETPKRRNGSGLENSFHFSLLATCRFLLGPIATRGHPRSAAHGPLAGRKHLPCPNAVDATPSRWCGAPRITRARVSLASRAFQLPNAA